MKRKKQQYTYTLLDEMMASATEPLPQWKRTHQITKMLEAIASLEKSEKPTETDWKICSDAVNILECMTLESNIQDADGVPQVGWWRCCDGEWIQVQDTSGLIREAIVEMGTAAHRFLEHGAMRLSGRGIMAVRAVIEDYAAILDVLPARTMIRAHRLTERRILQAIKRPGGGDIVIELSDNPQLCA